MEQEAAGRKDLTSALTGNVQSRTGMLIGLEHHAIIRIFHQSALEINLGLKPAKRYYQGGAFMKKGRYTYCSLFVGLLSLC